MAGSDIGWLLVAVIFFGWMNGWGTSHLNDEARVSDFTLVRCNPDAGLDSEMRCIHFAGPGTNLKTRVNPLSHTVQIVFEFASKNATRERFFDDCVVVDFKNWDCIESRTLDIKPIDLPSGVHVGSFQGRLYVRELDGDASRTYYSSVGGLAGWAYRHSILPLKGALVLSGEPAVFQAIPAPPFLRSSAPPPLYIKPVEPKTPPPGGVSPPGNTPGSQ